MVGGLLLETSINCSKGKETSVVSVKERLVTVREGVRSLLKKTSSTLEVRLCPRRRVQVHVLTRFSRVEMGRGSGGRSSLSRRRKVSDVRFSLWKFRFLYLDVQTSPHLSFRVDSLRSMVCVSACKGLKYGEKVC